MMKTYTYTVHIEPGEDGYLIVSVPALPGCFTQAKTYEEAVAHAQEAILCYLEALSMRGEPIPEEPHPAQLVAIGVQVPIPATA